MHPLRAASASLPGAVRMLLPRQLAGAAAELEEARYVVARIVVTPALRGRLGPAVQEALEGALATRGAMPSSLADDAAPDVYLSEALLRSRALEAPGLALAMPGVHALSGPNGELEPGDERVVRAWLEASQREPVALLFERADGKVTVTTSIALEMFAGSAGEPEPQASRPSGVWTKPASDQGTEPPRVERPVLTPVPPRARQTELGLPPERIVDGARWRNLASELASAKGPRPPKQIEDLFRTHYVPLLGAGMRREIDGATRNVVGAWAASFEHSYLEAFPALRASGTRPTMVLDAPQLAARLTRLNGARSTQLLLIDSMRFEVGEQIATRLEALLAGHAILVDRMLLWSALPTVTPMQLTLLAKGPEALREEVVQEDPDLDVSRNRAVGTIRRMRIGSRDLLKLDLIEARVRSHGPTLDERVVAIADEVAPIVAELAKTMAQRTLLFMFGDHGFRMEPGRAQDTTSAAEQGGASPEEVLVPAYAWLVGGVH